MEQWQRAWQEVRALRASPPERVREDEERGAVFSAALTQAQELAEAAAVSGHATKPLTLYYSLTQGVRAAAAASVPDRAWRVRGHGARVMPGADVLQASIEPRPSVQVDRRDALSMMAQLEHQGAPMTEAFTVGSAWAALAPTAWSPPGEPVELTMAAHEDEESTMRAAVGEFHAALRELPATLTDEELEARLAAYPTLRGWRSARATVEAAPPDQPAGRLRLAGPQATWNDRTPRVGLKLPGWEYEDPVTVLIWDLEGKSHAERFAELARTPTGQEHYRLLTPSVGGVDASAWPVLLQALLLGLSSLVRYEPAQWTRAIDPDQAVTAVPIEQLCERLQHAVPDLLHKLIVGGAG